VIFGVCFSYPIKWALDNLRVRYLEGVEEPLVDHANVLAAMVEREMEAGGFDHEKWYRAFENVRSRSLSARIYNLLKTDVDMKMYITDGSGRIIFDSDNRQNVGADYSGWQDVSLTLEGKYGARSSAGNTEDPAVKVLHVAAPVMLGGEIAGVLTVAKPTTNINRFLKSAKPQLFKVGAIAALAAVLLTYVASVWLTRPIKRLTDYANAIREGKRVEFPKLDRSEIGEMGYAFAKMQETLEGKKYVEEYVQKLTHEVKSPLSAIRGAAELLDENMEPEQRTRFLSNIRHEANRIQEIVDRMLELSALENQKMLEKMERLSFPSLVKTVIETKRPLLAKKNLIVSDHVPENILVEGDAFLLHQALSNVIQNAIDFSSAGGQIRLSGRVENNMLQFIVEDDGTGIPDFAVEKVFDKFFSLQRPDTGKKSTGLGLSLVKEVTGLHHGDVKLENRPEIGARAILWLPVSSGQAKLIPALAQTFSEPASAAGHRA
jgi:two-component system sensor histidine kinase CreC